MPETKVLNQVCDKGIDKETLAARVAGKAEMLQELFDGLTASRAAVRYGCEKVLRRASEIHPEALSSRIDRYIGLLDSEDTFLKWGAILAIGNLARVDADGRIDDVLDKYLSPIEGPVMITAGNTLVGAAQIAQAKPHLTETIVRAFLKVEKAAYKTAECRDIACGHAITAFDVFFSQIPAKGPVLAFVMRQLESPRNATRKKAERFLKKYKGGR